MANNPYVNKVIVGNQTIIDLTGDTVAAEKMLSGATAHDASGAPVTGTMFGVGSIYATTANNDPASILGFGTWILIRESPMTWSEMKKHTWGELKTDTWGHRKFCPVVYVWKRTA